MSAPHRPFHPWESQPLTNLSTNGNMTAQSTRLSGPKEVVGLKRLVAFSFAMMLLVTGCSSQKTEPSAQHDHGQASVPVMKYEIGSNDWSALEAYAPKDDVMEAYQFAVDHPEVLNYMPCYCGCYEDDGHTSNTHCFVDQVEDNVAILDFMGLG